MDSKNKKRLSCSPLDGGIKDISKPNDSKVINSESDLANYLHMPYQKLDDIKPFDQSNIEEGKKALEITLNRAKIEEPNSLVKHILFDFWGKVEIDNVHMSSEGMARGCKTYLEAVKQLKLYEQLENPVKECFLI